MSQQPPGAQASGEGEAMAKRQRRAHSPTSGAWPTPASTSAAPTYPEKSAPNPLQGQVSRLEESVRRLEEMIHKLASAHITPSQTPNAPAPQNHMAGGGDVQMNLDRQERPDRERSPRRVEQQQS